MATVTFNSIGSRTTNLQGWRFVFRYASLNSIGSRTTNLQGWRFVFRYASSAGSTVNKLTVGRSHIQQYRKSYY